MRRLGILIVVPTFYNYLYLSFMKVFKLSVKEGQVIVVVVRAEISKTPEG